MPDNEENWNPAGAEIECDQDGCGKIVFATFKFCWEHLQPNDQDSFIRQLITKLSKPMRPEQFMDIVKVVYPIWRDYFFTNAFGKISEAWVAGQFARGLEQKYGSLKVQLIEESFPDFILYIDEKEYQFELTEALKPNRKRDDEFRKYGEDPEGDFPEPNGQKELEEEEKEGPSWVAEAVNKKAKKHYSEPPHLLVYANFWVQGIDQKIIEKFCENYLKAFSSIWIFEERVPPDCSYIQLYNNQDNIFRETDHEWHNTNPQ